MRLDEVRGAVGGPVVDNDDLDRNALVLEAQRLDRGQHVVTAVERHQDRGHGLAVAGSLVDSPVLLPVDRKVMAWPGSCSWRRRSMVPTSVRLGSRISGHLALRCARADRPHLLPRGVPPRREVSSPTPRSSSGANLRSLHRLERFNSILKPGYPVFAARARRWLRGAASRVVAIRRRTPGDPRRDAVSLAAGRLGHPVPRRAPRGEPDLASGLPRGGGDCPLVHEAAEPRRMASAT